jgi:hypothetical protein
MTLEPEKPTSQVILRVGYISNINERQDALKLDEFGLTTRAAYYHKSGLFLDATGYWSNQSESPYYMTETTIGYMSAMLKKWSYLIEYSHDFYHNKDPFVSSIDNGTSPVFTNIFAATGFFHYKNFDLTFNYSFLKGDRIGHRFRPSIFYTFQKRNWLGLQRVSFSPTFSLLLGVEQIPTYRKLYNNRLEALYRIRNGLPLFKEELNDEFGVMNYVFRLPLSVNHNNWGFTLSYSYNFPQRLPGQVSTFYDGGSLTFSIAHYIEIKGH